MRTLVKESDHYSPEASTQSGVEQMIVPHECAGLRLDQALARMFPSHSRSRLQDWLRDGRVRLDGLLANEPKRKVWGGESLALEQPPTPEERAESAEDIPLAIVFEDAHLLVIDKPAGLVVHPGSGNWSGTLLNALLHHAPELAGVPRAGIVHRLDKDTSGLLVVARTLESQTALIRQLQARTVKRHYYALVIGDMRSGGMVDAPIGRHPVNRLRMAVVDGAREARTHYRVCERFGCATLVQCMLETGRTHQIRVHMQHLGHPLVGDPVYGPRRVADPRLSGFARQALHAFRLGLLHPASGQEMQWEVPMAEDMAQLIVALGGEAGYER